MPAGGTRYRSFLIVFSCLGVKGWGWALLHKLVKGTFGISHCILIGGIDVVFFHISDDKKK
ncbi:hypothetical protein F5Y10DRAFT_251604 [Nemania abortiva]|nr:hypothetical protein F5Y10DRAFT_251604 [Nemania abortiva]